MPIKDSELTGKTPPLSTDGRITPDTGHDRYDDWHQDDTERDPTPANKRRTEMQKATHPTAREGVVKGFHGQMNTQGTTSGVTPGGFLKY